MLTVQAVRVVLDPHGGVKHAECRI